LHGWLSPAETRVLRSVCFTGVPCGAPQTKDAWAMGPFRPVAALALIAAGSTLTLDRALRNIVALGFPLASALQMVTANPARQIGLGSRKGVLAAGADADLVFLDEKLEVSGVMTRGAGLALSN